MLLSDRFANICVFNTYRTPLIKLPKLSEATGCSIAVKCEFANGGGSVKDRAALFLIKEAIEKGIVLHVFYMNFELWGGFNIVSHTTNMTFNNVSSRFME